MRVAVYPGSFDPLHVGHLSILRALGKDPSFEWTYLVVSPQNPLKDRDTTLSSARRIADASLALARHPELKASVDDIELLLPPPQYTFRTLEALGRREPENEFTLVVGADNLAQIRRWKEYRRILSEWGVVVYPRCGFDARALREDLLGESGEYRIGILDAPLVDISSTRIRNAIAEGQDVSEFLF